MKVTWANKQYRNKVLGLDKKDFRDLQKGKVVDVKKDIVASFPDAFIKLKEEDNGSINTV